MFLPLANLLNGDRFWRNDAAQFRVPRGIGFKIEGTESNPPTSNLYLPSFTFARTVPARSCRAVSFTTPPFGARTTHSTLSRSSV